MGKTAKFDRLALASRAFELSARAQVVEAITGVSRRELEKIFYDLPALHENSGRMPDSPEWFLSANVVVAFHLAAFYSFFRAATARGIAPPDALITAYRKYLSRFGHDVRVDFNRAFLLVSMVEGLWRKETPALEAIQCPKCHGLYIGALGDGARQQQACPLCKVAKTFPTTTRVSGPLKHPALADLIDPPPHSTA
jgi:hypothetical protein